MMRPTTVGRLKAFGVALALLVAADAAEPPSPLIGATRDQVIGRNGEPKSQIVVGNRVIMFFAKERVVLRDGVVIEVEKIVDRPAPAPMPAPSAATTETTTGATAVGERPAAPATGTTAASSGTTAPSAAATPAPTTVSVPPPETAAGASEPRFEIKSIRRPGEPAPQRPVTKQEPAPTQKREPAPAAPVVSSLPVQQPAATTPSATATARDSAPMTTGTVATTAAPEAEEPKPEEPAEEPVKKKPGRKARQAASEPDIPDTEDIINSKGNYFIAFLVAATGIGYIVWQARQRKLALAATAVSRAPFSMPVVVKTGVVFNADLLQSLEWKRFEELVASYYSKTGVVAVRTKSGPTSPVHIKISWKGEPLPFAYVQCVAQQPGLIEAKPLQELVNALAADDIRRGYVVSTGKFGVNARDLAEEKHITLLSGDIFLEKLNALPDAARSELMQQITTGDYTTPSCPKCETKMVRSLEDPMIFRCPTHADQQIASRG